MMTRTVLITGANGLIGSQVRKALAHRYELRLLARRPIEGVEATVADIAQFEAIRPAFEGVDSVIHLAASAAVQSPWDAVLHNNIIGTYNVFEAARQAGVKQVIFASSNHAVGTYEMLYQSDPDQPTSRTIDHLVPVAPDSLYGVSKVFGEALGRYYADHHGLRVICLRIGWINAQDAPEGKPFAADTTMWQSMRDFVHMVERCLEAETIRFDIFYGVSDNPHRLFDLEHARQVLGYHPRDNAIERLRERGRLE